jgi:hypothetical protein
MQSIEQLYLIGGAYTIGVIYISALLIMGTQGLINSFKEHREEKEFQNWVADLNKSLPEEFEADIKIKKEKVDEEK